MKKMISLGFVGLCSLFLIGCGNNNMAKNSNSSNDSSKNVVEKAINNSKDSTKASFKDNILESPNYKIEFQNTEVLDGYEGSKVLVVNYLYTNNSDKDRSPSTDFIFDISFTQDAEKTTEDLSMGLLGYEVEEAHPEIKERSAMSVKDVKPGATVESVSLLKLVNDSPVIVTFSDGINDIEGTKTIEVK